MKIFNHSEAFQCALNHMDYAEAEAIIGSSDRKKEMIKECLDKGTNTHLEEILPSFRSRGLVKSIQNMLEELKKAS